MPQLEFKSYPGQILWLLIVWSLIYLMTAYFFIPGMQKIFRQRSEITKKQLEAAAAMILQCNQLNHNINSTLEKARSQALSIKSTAKLVAKTTIADKTVEAESIVEKQIGKDMERIRRLEQRIRQGLPDVAERLSGEIISNLLGKDSNLKSAKN